MRCHNCGSENDKIAKFCAVCGQKLEPENEEVYQKPKKNREDFDTCIIDSGSSWGVRNLDISGAEREEAISGPYSTG